MRAILVILALAALVLAALLYFGVITLSAQPGEVRPPVVHADVGKVTVEQRTVTVPTLNVEKPGQPANTQAAH
ncbi:MAG: hypothetical protein JO157_00525 [Acetobacteraceae bacterium]|nr:hypothetical protein [Acetobacteraceae bacterium]